MLGRTPPRSHSAIWPKFAWQPERLGQHLPEPVHVHEIRPEQIVVNMPAFAIHAYTQAQTSSSIGLALKTCELNHTALSSPVIDQENELPFPLLYARNHCRNACQLVADHGAIRYMCVRMRMEKVTYMLVAVAADRHKAGHS